MTDTLDLVTMLAVEEVAERFLEEEAANPVPGVDPADRARFHRLVRQCAANWLLHPKAGLRLTRGKNSLALQFEGPLGGKAISVFCLRAHGDSRDFRFVGPNPDRKKLGLAPASLAALERLHDLYEAFLADKSGGDAVTSVFKGGRLPDLVPLVEETRRALDGGQETSPSIPPHPVTIKKKAIVARLTTQGPALPVGFEALASKPAVGGSAPMPRTASPMPQPSIPRIVAQAQKTSGPPTPSVSVSPGSGSFESRAPKPSRAAPPPAAKPQPVSKTAPPPKKASAPPAAAARSGPTLAYIMLACQKPKLSADFYSRLFQIKPAKRTREGTYFEFHLGGVALALQEDFDAEERKTYGYKPLSKQRGAGAILQVRVNDYDLCIRRARGIKGSVLKDVPEASSFVVRDPAGYLVEIVKA